jgi:zinc resistance-associated protein
MKRVLTAAGIMTLVAALAIPALAQGPGMGRGFRGQGGSEDCPGHRYSGNLTEEQKSQMDKLHQKFFDQTAPLRSQIAAKHSELNILMNTSNPDLEKAKALQKELTDLKGKMGQERINLYAEERKIDPNARFGMGYGRGMGGPGRGMGGPGPGMGRHRGDSGPGHCWN